MTNAHVLFTLYIQRPYLVCMNFLAHFYLSFDDPDLLVGNFIGDHVKGRKHENYKPGVQSGILLHRFIDSYTDTHEVVSATNALLRPSYKKFAPVLSDIFFDHFLARRWEEFHDVKLGAFTGHAYQILNENADIMPERSRMTLHYMQMQDWLSRYAEIEGIQQSLNGMNRRTGGIGNLDKATRELEEYYDEIDALFSQFFPDVTSAAKDWIQKRDL